MQNSVNSGAETIGNAIEMFDDIADAVTDAERGVEEISDAAEDQAVSTEEVVAMVDEVSAVSEESAAEASNVSAATEEQTAAIDEVTTSVQGVSQSAKSLQELVTQFQVGEDSGTSGRDVDASAVSGSVEPATDGGDWEFDRQDD